ncbi:ribonuclease P protein subunit RPR2 [Tuber indicum]|nr:ribonuclease P protein subunit RPR2 [Tuber indicum]
MVHKKPANSAQAPPRPHLFARLNYLHQSAHLLLTSGSPNLSRNLVSTARTVAKKTVIRFDPSVKRTWCKRCDAVLVPGVSCEHRVENLSRGGRKAWADVLVVRCWGCGCLKRFPVGRGGRRGEGGGKEGGKAREGECNVAGEGKGKKVKVKVKKGGKVGDPTG